MLPVKLLLEAVKDLNKGAVVNDKGIEPLKLLLLMWTSNRVATLPQSSLRVPENWLFCISKWM